MQTVFDTPTLEDRIMNLSRELATIKDELETATSRYSLYKNAQAVLHGRIDLASATIKQAIIQDDIDKDTLIQIASDLQVELTREVRIKMRITASGTAIVPIDFDLDDIDGEISVDFSNNYGTDTELDIDVDDMIVDCEDI
jgi:hypothetical protein